MKFELFKNTKNKYVDAKYINTLKSTLKEANAILVNYEKGGNKFISEGIEISCCPYFVYSHGDFYCKEQSMVTYCNIKSDCFYKRLVRLRNLLETTINTLEG